MAESLRRVSIHTCDDEAGSLVDLSLPAGMEVGQLIPSIVDIAGINGDGPARGWWLSRIGEAALNESTTLAENGIQDGDVLVLSAVDAAPPAPLIRDQCATVAATARDTTTPQNPGAAVCLWMAGIGAMALAWPADANGSVRVATATVMALAVAAAAVMAHRARAAALSCAVLHIVAVVLAGVAGYLVLPSYPANVFLAASAAASAAVIFVHICCCGTVVLTALATLSLEVAAATGPAVVWPLSTGVAGATLVVISLGKLALAPRLSIVAAGLTTPTADGIPDRAWHGRQTLTGLVGGSACGTAVGATLVVLDCLNGNTRWLSGAAFAAVVGAVLLLRSRSHVDAHRRIVFVVSGILCITAAFALVITSLPTLAGWGGVLAIGAALAVLGPPVGRSISPVARRAVDVLEYLALAAVVPLACWVADVYGLVRGLGPT